MDDDIRKQSFWPYLTYSMQKQTQELLKRKDVVDNFTNKATLLSIPFAIILMFFILFKRPSDNFDYLYYAMMLTVLVVPVYILFQHLSSLNKKFNDMRVYVMKNIDEGFCTHHEHTCSCKDQYIKYMESRNINLFFS